MKLKTLLMGAGCAVGLALSPLSAMAQNLVYLVQPEPPSLAS